MPRSLLGDQRVWKSVIMCSFCNRCKNRNCYDGLGMTRDVAKSPDARDRSALRFMGKPSFRAARVE